MEQITVIRETLATAYHIERCLREKRCHHVDVESLDKWTEAMTRYVLFHVEQHNMAQQLENLSRQLYVESVYDDVRMRTIHQYLDIFYKATEHLRHLHDEIQWNPPLDSSYYPPPLSEPNNFPI
jgi:hypothetical protein